jgi:hypothetical protein
MPKFAPLGMPMLLPVGRSDGMPKFAPLKMPMLLPVGRSDGMPKFAPLGMPLAEITHKDAIEIMLDIDAVGSG